jgi:hypothetical protein
MYVCVYVCMYVCVCVCVCEERAQEREREMCMCIGVCFGLFSDPMSRLAFPLCVQISLTIHSREVVTTMTHSERVIAIFSAILLIVMYYNLYLAGIKQYEL